MKIPALAEDAHRLGVCGKQRLQVNIIFHLFLFAAGASKCHQFCMVECQLTHPFKKFQILWIGTWISCLNIIDAQLIQRLHDIELVLH